MGGHQILLSFLAGGGVKNTFPSHTFRPSWGQISKKADKGTKTEREREGEREREREREGMEGVREGGREFRWRTNSEF